MNKTTEALKLAEEAFWEGNEHFHGMIPKQVIALQAIRDALAEPVCEHRIADARNEFVKDGYICIKCGALFRAADHAEPVKQEPVSMFNWRNGSPVSLRQAAPVDAKAILEMRDKAFQSYVDQVKVDRELSVLQARLEALEEAAKVCDDAPAMQAAFTLAAAIRSLK